MVGVEGGGEKGVVLGGGRIVAASEMLRPSVGHIQQAEGMTLRAKSSLTIRFPVGISNLLELEGRLLHKIKANRRREMIIKTHEITTCSTSGYYYSFCTTFWM